MEMLQAPESLGTQLLLEELQTATQQKRLLLEQLPLLQAALRMAMLLVRGRLRRVPQMATLLELTPLQELRRRETLQA